MPPAQNLPQFLLDRLRLPLPGSAAQTAFAPELSYGRHCSPSPPDARRAAVMLLLFHHAGSWYLPLTVRPQTLAAHAGQISLPGGALELDETVEQAALRELSEEVGVGPQGIELLGRLTDIYIFASNFVVTPCVGVFGGGRPDFCPSPLEVANLLEPKLVELLDPQGHRQHQIVRRAVQFRAPHLEYRGQRIWGATSMILAEFLALVREAANKGSFAQ